ncbi:MAG: molecular chaperone HtpG [Clostridia bacterium]|nr:molecular chaperone HtpG [Clostridia bacterium]
MAKKQFKAQSKRLLEMMIHSIYSQKEIFLRELISNASDAIDKSYYYALQNENISFDKDDFYIRLSVDTDKRLLTVEDTGIGMSAEELEKNLGTIAESGSFAFRKESDEQEGVDIIGQFGVGFYSAFMVADEVTVLTKRAGAEACQWYSKGADGYTVTPAEKDTVGTLITLHIKEDTAEEDYSQYLDTYRLQALVRKHSDFIKYPIKMLCEETRPVEGKEGETETVLQDRILNSMVPIWRKNKNELTAEDYENFYMERRYGWQKPLKYIHTGVDGEFSYTALLYIPSAAPFNYYSKDFEKGLALYSSGVMIMEKCGELLPDCFGFVQGLVDSSDISLNISREILQQDRTLKLIAKNIEKKIKKELDNLLKNDREGYEKFFAEFGRQLKFGLYESWGQNKTLLQDLLLFHSGKQDKLITLAEYTQGMKEEDKVIYYATGESVARIGKMPQTESVLAEGKDVLFFTEQVDEFAIKVLGEYAGKTFRNVSEVDPAENTLDQTPFAELLEFAKKTLGGKVSDITVSDRLSGHPVCLRARGELSIEMEKTLSQMPQGGAPKAEKVLEINASHDILEVLKASLSDEEKAAAIVRVLYAQALLIEGLTPEDPVGYANDVCNLIK